MDNYNQEAPVQQGWQETGKNQGFEELPKVKKGPKLISILGGLAAVLLVVGVAAASYYVSNRISGRVAVAPTAPGGSYASTCDAGCAYGSCPSGSHSAGGCPGSNYMICCEKNAPTPTATPVPTPRPTATATPQPPQPPTCGSGLSCGANPSGCSTCRQPGGGNTCCCPSGKVIVNNQCVSPSVCTSGTSRCKTASTTENCVSGQWQTGVSCAYGCTNGSCNPNPNACTSGTSRCKTASTIENCVSGVWQVGVSCVNGCTNGSCNTYPACGSGLSCGSNPSGCSTCRQSGGTNTCCCPSGQTIVNNVCTAATQNCPGSPGCPGYVCTSGDKRCKTASTIENCVYGAWQVGVSCVYGCNNGVCNSATPTATPTGTGQCPSGTTRCSNGPDFRCCTSSQTCHSTSTYVECVDNAPAGTCSLGTDCSKYASMPAGCSRCDCGCKWIISGSCKASGSGPNCNDVCAGQCATPTTKPTPTNPPPGNVCDAAHRDAPFSNSLTFGKAGTVYVFTRNTSGTITLSGPKTVAINSSNSGAAVQQPTTFTVNAGETYNLTVKLSNESGNAYGWRPTKAVNTCGPTNAVCGGNVDITPLVNLATANSDVSNVLANGYAANTQCWGDQALGDQTQDFDYNDFSIIFGYLKEVVTPTPTPTIVPGPQCVSAKVYALNTSGQWAEVANPSTLTSGTKVRFGAIGSTTTVKRARFNINSAGWQASESKMVVGNSTVFYFEYTLKAGSYSIESEIQ